MNKRSDSLFNLIKSLNKSEKGYFLKHWKKEVGEDSQYMRLFSLIDSEKEYDEAIVLKFFKKEFPHSQFHVSKNYLYNKILKNLFLFNSGSPLFIVTENILSFNNLFEKGLYKEAYNILLKTKILAAKYELYSQLIQLIKLHKKFVLKFMKDDISETLNQLSLEDQGTMKLIINISGYRKLYDEIYVMIKLEGSIRNTEVRNKYLKIIKNPLIKDEKKALTYESRILYCLILFIYYQAETDDEMTLKSSVKLIEQIKKNNFRTAEFSRELILAMGGHLSASFNLGLYKKSFEMIKAMRNYNVSSIELRQYIFFSTYLIEILINIHSCRFKEGLSMIGSIEKGLKKYGSKVPESTEIILYEKLFYLYFVVGDFSNALKWNNKILNLNQKVRMDIYSNTLICNLLIHYELNNIELLRYALINTYRFFYKNKRLYKFEEVVLKYIRKLSVSNNLHYEFSILKKELRELSKDAYERVPLEYFDYICWLDSKINNKTFVEVKIAEFQKK